MICPLCHKTHSDGPSPTRNRICLACFEAALSGPVPFRVPAVPKKTKRTPKNKD